MKLRQSVVLAVAASLLLGTTACAGLRIAKPYSANEIHDASKASGIVKDAAGWVDASGVPSLAERLAKRPNLKLAVLQFSVWTQGEHDKEQFDSFGFRTTGNWSSWMEQRQTVKGFQIAPQLGQRIAGKALLTLEQELTAQGFKVVPAAQVAATSSYQQAFGKLPYYTTVKDEGTSASGGWTGFTAGGLRIKPAKSFLDTLNVALAVEPRQIQAIEKELGEDVLFLLVSSKLGNQQLTKQANAKAMVYDRKGQFEAGLTLNVVDPDFVGYGVGGFGHMVGTSDVRFLPAPRPEFIKKVQGGWDIDWPGFVKDADRVHELSFGAMSQVMKEKALPAKN